MFARIVSFPTGNSTILANFALPLTAESTMFANIVLSSVGNDTILANIVLPRLWKVQSLPTLCLPRSAKTQSLPTLCLPRSAKTQSLPTLCLPRSAKVQSLPTLCRLQRILHDVGKDCALSARRASAAIRDWLSAPACRQSHSSIDIFAWQDRGGETRNGGFTTFFCCGEVGFLRFLLYLCVSKSELNPHCSAPQPAPLKNLIKN